MHCCCVLSVFAVGQKTHHFIISMYQAIECVYQVQEEGNYFMNRKCIFEFLFEEKREIDSFVFCWYTNFFIVETTVYFCDVLFILLI